MMTILSQPIEFIYDKDDYLLLIGITSAQDHVKERQSLRNTWLTLMPKSDIMYYFLIGKHICSIPPLDRESFSVCKEKKVNLPKNLTEYTPFSTYGRNIEGIPIHKGHGFQFSVMHGIVIHYLGIQRQVLRHTAIARVSLYDTFRDEKILTATFILDEEDNTDYLWKKVPPVHLSTDFDAEVRVEGFADLSGHCECRQTWADEGFIRYLSIVRPNSTVQFNTDSCSLSAFNFTVKDADNITSHVATKDERLESWRNHMKEVQDSLQREVNEQKDILLLDMVDVYHNLPLKVLLFYEWAAVTQRFKYLLKTDDDTFINILQVESELKQNNDWDWWSCFRKGWPVQRAGKWKETKFDRTVYPTFPSGAGYVLARNVILLLYENIHDLQTNYQGEDVSLGIWVEGYNLKEHVGDACSWTCNEVCFSDACNVGQLSSEEMYLMMEAYNMSSKRFNCLSNTIR